MAFFNNKNREIVLQGRNIYRDKHNRFVYYQKRTKTGFVVSADKLSKFQFLNARYVLGICVIALAYSFHLGIVWSSALGIAIMLVMELMFRFQMLPSLTQIPNFDVTGKPGQLENLANSLSRGRLYLLSVLYVVFAVLFVLLGFENDYDQAYWILVAIVCLGCAYFAIIHIRAAHYQAAHKIETKAKTIQLKIKK